MPAAEAPNVELGSAPRSPLPGASPSPSEISSASSPEPQNISAPPMFSRILAMPPPEPEQPAGQDELERRLPGYRRIVIPRDLTLIELLKQSSGVTTDDEVLRIREAKLRVMAERVGLRRLNILTPRLRSLTLDGSALSSLRDLGIGLVHLKILSVNRCGLTSLDGVWGLSSLRELHAAANRLQDLQALAALQKLRTLNLADNPIEDSSRLWMLGVCGGLRRLTLRGARAADEPAYRANVAAALPLLTHLDDYPIHAGPEDEMERFEDGSSSESEVEAGAPAARAEGSPAGPEPGPSELQPDLDPDLGIQEDLECLKLKTVTCRGQKLHRLRRPATTESVGVRPRVQLPPRPKTAHEKPNIDAPTRLQILNTLMDEEWRCSGSRLTSHETVCGNLAQALRRPLSTRRPTSDRRNFEELVEAGVAGMSRTLAEEIPRAPGLADWTLFKEQTGIEIDIDFNQRPKEVDPLSAIERLERIERETKERLSKPEEGNVEEFSFSHRNRFTHGISDDDLWKMENIVPLPFDVTNDVNTLFNNIGLVRTPEDSLGSRE